MISEKRSSWYYICEHRFIEQLESFLEKSSTTVPFFPLILKVLQNYFDLSDMKHSDQKYRISFDTESTIWCGADSLQLIKEKAIHVLWYLSFEKESE